MPAHYYTTIGTEFAIKEIDVNGEMVKAKIWDTAGQERFRTITKSFYQQAHGILLVYDVTERESFIKLSEWIQSINEKADANIARYLVANKIDLIDDRKVTPEEGKLFAKQHQLEYYETSAKDGKNVKDVFDACITRVHLTKRTDDKQSFHLSTAKAKEKVKSKCC